MPDPAEWITVPHVAKLLGLQQNTVYGLIDRGELAGDVVVPIGPKRRRRVLAVVGARRDIGRLAVVAHRRRPPR